MCNRKRKMAINKFMKKYKLEMLDSIKIWLMTPEVVSDILPLEKNTFDIVIFDEASQLYVEKSIPAIYRSNKVVIAGDLKQLKPSSLGQGRILDEPDEMDDEISDGFLDYESLLDAARFKFKHTMLSYHYRSKYEELIAFSNYAFYDGKLIVTSVANKTEEKPIERIKVDDGLWIDKKNVAEAKCVVKKLKEILKSRKNNETIGVITFNSSQMTLIEDLIEKEKLLNLIELYNKEYNFVATIPISATQNENTNKIITEIEKNLPEGPAYYDVEEYTDQTERQLVEELIREKALRLLDQEVPHGIYVEVEKMKLRKTSKNQDIYDIEATIYVLRKSHKGIVIGKDGNMLKRIGTNARQDIEKMLDTKVNLKLWVKIKEGWQDNDSIVKKFKNE